MTFGPVFVPAETLHPYLTRIAEGGRLTEDEAADAMDVLLQGRASPEETAALLLGLRGRGESLDELTGLTSAMRKHAVQVTSPDEHTIDVVGTGGDRSGSFNISTTTLFVCAGAGATVAKHGNRSVSSRSGSADVLDALGVRVDLPAEGVEACLREAGVGFMFAPRYHPALRHVMPVRRALGVRTAFNILGPLCSPAGIDRGLFGAFSIEVAENMVHILARLGAKHVVAVHSEDGMDELSISAPTRVLEWTGEGEPEARTVRPEDFGLSTADPRAVLGGEAEENAEILRAVLNGESGARRDVVVLNAAFALVAAGRAGTPGQGVALAQDAIDTGAAAAKLDALVQASNDYAD